MPVLQLIRGDGVGARRMSFARAAAQPTERDVERDFERAMHRMYNNGRLLVLAEPVAELPDDELDTVIRSPRDPSAVRKLADMVDDGETNGTH